jgi:cytochrome c
MNRRPLLAALVAALTLAGASAVRAQGPAGKGDDLFAESCAGCHTIEKDEGPTVGPNLWGVHGAKAGVKPGFDYSMDLKNAGLVWNDQTLDRWLASPSALVAGTVMGFAGFKDPSDRAAIIVYLKSKGG